MAANAPPLYSNDNPDKHRDSVKDHQRPLVLHPLAYSALLARSEIDDPPCNAGAPSFVTARPLSQRPVLLITLHICYTLVEA